MGPRHGTTAMALLLGLAAAAANAGRPLASDDAGVAAKDSCQIEAWHERSPDARGNVAAAACGVASGWELGLDVARASGERRVDLAWNAKWAVASTATALGELGLGLKIGSGWARQSGAGGHGWSRSGSWATGIATLEAAADLALHLNLGTTHAPVLRGHATTLGAALAWSGLPRGLLFVEVQGNDRADSFGAAQRTAGWRHWIVDQTFGLDLTVGRESGVPGKRWSLGFGWYGL